MDSVPKPSQLTVSETLQEVGLGFALMSRNSQGKALGIYPYKTTVHFSATASVGDNSKLVLDLSASPGSGMEKPLLNVGAKTNTGLVHKASGERSSMIEIAIVKPGCLPKDTLGFVNPELVGEANIGMSDAKI